MPYKFNAARRHKFDKAQYRVINWAEYHESLRQRGDLTIWVSGEAQRVWRAPRRTSRGGQRNRIETQIDLSKSVIGPRLRSRSFSRQITEIQVGQKVLNTMTARGRPVFERIA